MRFIPGMFRKRVQHDTTPKEQDTPTPPPVIWCAYCDSQDHATDDCHHIIRPGDTERTWQSGDFPDRFPGQGDTFEKVRSFFQRFRGEG